MKSTREMTEEDLLFAYVHHECDCFFLDLYKRRWADIYGYLNRFLGGDNRLTYVALHRTFRRESLLDYQQNEPARAYLIRKAGNHAVDLKRDARPIDEIEVTSYGR